MNNAISQNNCQSNLTQNLILKSFSSTALNFTKKSFMSYYCCQKTQFSDCQDKVFQKQGNFHQFNYCKDQDHSGAKSYKSQQTTFSTPKSTYEHEKSPQELDFDSNQTSIQKITTQKSQSQIQNNERLQYLNQSKQNKRKVSQIIQVISQNQTKQQDSQNKQRQYNTKHQIQVQNSQKIKISKNLQNDSNYFFIRPTIFKCAKTICQKIRMSREVYFLAMQLIDQYYGQVLCPYKYDEFVNIFYGCTIIASKVVSKKILNTPFVARTIRRKQQDLIELQFKLIKFFKYKVYRQTFVMRLGNYLQQWNQICPQIHLFDQNIKSFSIYYKILKILQDCASHFEIICDKTIRQTIKKVISMECQDITFLQKSLQNVFNIQQQKQNDSAMIEETLEKQLNLGHSQRIQFVQKYSFQQTEQRIVQIFQLRRNTEKYPTYTIFLNSLY